MLKGPGRSVSLSINNVGFFGGIVGLPVLPETCQFGVMTQLEGFAQGAVHFDHAMSAHVGDCSRLTLRWNKAGSFHGWLKALDRDLRARRVNRIDPPKPSKTKDEGSGTAVALTAN